MIPTGHIRPLPWFRYARFSDALKTDDRSMPLTRLIEITNLISRIGTWIGGSLMLFASGIIGLEVILRKIFLISLGGADELASYALAIGTVWALSFTLIERAHIRVDALYMVLPGWLRAGLDLLALVAVTVFAGFLTWYAAGVLLTSIDLQATANTPLATPLWIPQGIWVMGLGLFVIIALLLTALTLLALIRGRVEDVNRLAGTKTVSEELEEGFAATQAGGKA